MDESCHSNNCNNVTLQILFNVKVFIFWQKHHELIKMFHSLALHICLSTPNWQVQMKNQLKRGEFFVVNQMAPASGVRIRSLNFCILSLKMNWVFMLISINRGWKDTAESVSAAECSVCWRTQDLSIISWLLFRPSPRKSAAPLLWCTRHSQGDK